MELTRDLASKIQEICENEITAYEKITRGALVVGGVVPPHVQIAKAIVVRILKLAAGKIKSLWDKLRTSEDERIITNIIDKLKSDDKTDEIIVKRTETFRKTYHVVKKQRKKED